MTEDVNQLIAWRKRLGLPTLLLALSGCQTVPTAEHRETEALPVVMQDLPSGELTEQSSDQIVPINHEDPPELLTPVETAQHWWEPNVQQSLRDSERQLPLDLDALLIRALNHSHQVRVFSDLPLIRETAIVEADAAFDWHAFLSSRWDDTSDPVGNTLTTGSSPRFRDNRWSNTAGLRKKTRKGGQFTIAQEFGLQDNNSNFFNPTQQGTTRLTLSYTHPLLRGSGKVYNESFVVLAQIDASVAHDEFSRQLQSHLLEVTRAYWGLYLERGILLQKQRSAERGEVILEKLERRREIDTVESQLVSAQATVANRRSQLLRARMAVRNAEARIRALVNDPEFTDFETLELIPEDLPTGLHVPVDMQTSLAEAFQQRPELSQSLKQIKAATVRLNMSKNELLPVLNVVTETYVAGLDDKYDIASSWNNQFDQGEPGYALGLQFEVPLQRRAAKSRLQRRHLELRQLRNQYQTTMETLKLEVEVSVREVQTAYQEMQAKALAMNANAKEVEYIQKRWELLPGENGSASLVLQNLLDAQERLSVAEEGFLKSQVTYNLALTNLKRSTGTLLNSENVATGRACVNGLPTLVTDKQRVEPVLQPAPEFSLEVPPPAPGAITPENAPPAADYDLIESPSAPDKPSPEKQPSGLESSNEDFFPED